MLLPVLEDVPCGEESCFYEFDPIPTAVRWSDGLFYTVSVFSPGWRSFFGFLPVLYYRDDDCLLLFMYFTLHQGNVLPVLKMVR